MPSLHNILLLALFFVQWCLAILVNSTIDDAFPDPRSGATIQYTPAAAWNLGGSCQPCTAKPDISLLYNNTWHDTTFYPTSGRAPFPNTPLNATIELTGSAVYVYCALARTAVSPTGNSDMTFWIDGSKVGEFVRTAPGLPGYEHNVLVYRNTSIPDGKHTFMIQNGRVDGPVALMMLDRIVYTYDDGVQAQSKQKLGVIIGGTLGGVAGLCILAIGFGYWFIKHRRERARKDALAGGASTLPQIVTVQSPLDAIPYPLTSPTNTYASHYASSPRIGTTLGSGSSGQDAPPGYYDFDSKRPIGYHKKR